MNQIIYQLNQLGWTCRGFTGVLEFNPRDGYFEKISNYNMVNYNIPNKCLDVFVYLFRTESLLHSQHSLVTYA